MTYKELIDTLTGIIDDHKLINQWGYGNLSDIETPETGAPNYPYTFINPVQVVMQSYGFDVTLNLIQMDQPLEGVAAEVDGVSKSLGLVQDIVSKLKLTDLYQQTDIELSITCTPFKERFKDNVVGVTAIITLQINEPLDACTDVITSFEEFASAIQPNDFTIDPDQGSAGAVLRYPTPVSSDTSIATWAQQFLQTMIDGTYRIEIAGNFTIAEPLGGEQLPHEPQLYLSPSGAYVDAVETNGNWPTVWSADEFYFEAAYEFTKSTTPNIVFITSRNLAPLESAITMKAGGTIKIYYGV